MIVGIALIVGGILIIAASRTVAAIFELPGNTAATTRFLGFGDDIGSRYRRWAGIVLLGLLCVGLGVAQLFY